jgi:hypothetical protein
MSVGAFFVVRQPDVHRAARGGGVRLTVILLAATTAASAFDALPQRPAAPVVASPTAPSQATERSAVGTLDHVDANATEIVVATASGKLTFQVQKGATIRQGSRTIKPAELAAHKGERVKIRYRENAGQRRTDWIMVAAPTPPRKSATPATRSLS